MAIKVNGTTVIDDSRNLSNVGGLKTVGGNNLVGSGDVGFKTVAGNNVVGSGDIGFKTVNGSSVVGSGDLTISSSDVAADAFGYAAYRTGGYTLYPGFNNGAYIHFGGQGSMTAYGTFTGGSFSQNVNYGSGQYYGSFAVRTS